LFIASIAVAVLATVGVVIERAALKKQRRFTEAKMEQSLAEMRKAIADFRVHRHRPPASLQELVTARYLPAIPQDPVTSAKNWREMVEESVQVSDFSGAPAPPPARGLVDVRSAAPGKDSNGKAWSEY
jgi:hypothetical protein